MTNPPKISLYKFKFTIQVLEDMHLPEYKGSMFRGAFGWAFRRAVCVTRRPTCENCIIKENCSYFKVFETEIAENTIHFLNGVKKVPHPFIIEPPLDEKRDYKKGDLLEVGLTLFGNSVKQFAFYVYTFQQMGEQGIGYKRGKFKLLSVSNLDFEEKETTIFTEASGKLKTNYSEINERKILSDVKNTIEKITLNFVTPFRLQFGGKVFQNSEKLNTQIVLSSLQRRVISVSHLFCENNVEDFIDIDFSGIRIIENNLEYKSVERYSNRQKKKMEMGGFIGEITFAGDIQKVIPIIYLCKELNVGKNTAFGLGKYILKQ